MLLVKKLQLRRGEKGLRLVVQIIKKVLVKKEEDPVQEVAQEVVQEVAQEVVQEVAQEVVQEVGEVGVQEENKEVQEVDKVAKMREKLKEIV